MARNPRNAEEWFDEATIAAAKAGHAQWSSSLRVAVPWGRLPIQSQDDWILTWHAMLTAYRAAGGTMSAVTPEPREQFGGPCPDLACEGLIQHAPGCPRDNDPIRYPLASSGS